MSENIINTTDRAGRVDVDGDWAKLADGTVDGLPDRFQDITLTNASTALDILVAPLGNGLDPSASFGYDAVRIPEGAGRTFKLLDFRHTHAISVDEGTDDVADGGILEFIGTPV